MLAVMTPLLRIEARACPRDHSLPLILLHSMVRVYRGKHKSESPVLPLELFCE